MRLPKPLGGPGGEHNPEELFAMGQLACEIFNHPLFILI